MRSEEATDLVKDAVWMVQDEVVGQTKDEKTSGGETSIAAAVAQGLGKCGAPSASTTRSASLQKKSTMKGPMGC